MANQDHIAVSPENQRAAGDIHGQAAEFLTSIPTNHDEIIQWVHSLGPIYRPVIPEITRLLNERHTDYTQQAQEHTALQSGLHALAAAWENHEHTAATNITEST